LQLLYLSRKLSKKGQQENEKGYFNSRKKNRKRLQKRLKKWLMHLMDLLHFFSNLIHNKSSLENLSRAKLHWMILKYCFESQMQKNKTHQRRKKN
jgi:hypothetical protein